MRQESVSASGSRFDYAAWMNLGNSFLKICVISSSMIERYLKFNHSRKRMRCSEIFSRKVLFLNFTRVKIQNLEKMGIFFLNFNTK